MALYDFAPPGLPRLPRPGMMSAGFRGATRERAPRLDPAEEESLLRSLGRKTVSGISAAGSFLDLPGSMVRDTIGLASTGDFSKYNPLDLSLIHI